MKLKLLNFLVITTQVLININMSQYPGLPHTLFSHFSVNLSKIFSSYPPSYNYITVLISYPKFQHPAKLTVKNTAVISEWQYYNYFFNNFSAFF